MAGSQRPVAEAPLTWRPGWLFLVFVAVAVPGSINGTRWAPGPLRVLLLLGLAWYVVWYVVFVANGKRWRVTFDGEVVDVVGRFGRRVRPGGLRWLVSRVLRRPLTPYG